MSKRKRSAAKQASTARSGISLPGALPHRLLAGAAIIVLAVLLAYIPSVTGGFILDDDALLTKNACIGSPDGLYQFWCTAKAEDYWPVTNSSLWIEWRLWGMNSAGYHVANLILHAAEALLIWIILRRLSIPGAFWAALIFAVHPVNVESVAWISQRKNMMAMLFFLLSILWYLKADMTRASVGLAPARSHGGPGELEKTFSSFILHPSSFHFCYWLSLAAFVLAMLSKGSAVILPVLLLGIVWWLRPLIRLDLMRTAPFFLVAMALAAVNMWFQTHGTAIVIRTASFSQRLLGAGGVLWFYLYKAIMPVDLVFIYPQWNIKTGNPLWWLPLFAALAVTAILWRNRASWGRPFLFAWGFFCVALAPAMGFTDVGFMKYSLVADHYQHIAIIGLIALVSAGWSAWHCLARGKAGWAATAVAIAAAAALTGLTWRQNMLYRGEITLYQSTLEKNPNCWLAHNNLGIAVVEAGRPQDAFPHYRQALLLRPGYHETLYNMGNAFRITGQNQQAIECYRQALEQKPDFIDALINLGLALDLANRPNEAILQYQKALDINPDLPDAQFHLGNAYKELGQYQKAIEHYRQSLLLKPDYIVQNDLGDLLARTGRISEAIEQYRQALAINPDFSVTHYNLGNALFQSGRTQEAIDHYRIALALKPDYFEVHNNLGAALIRAGRPQEAINHYKQGLRLKPNDTSLYMNLAVTYASVKQSSEAIAAAQKAIELARTQGQTELARQDEDWLNSYRAGLSSLPEKPPSKTASPP